MIIGKTPFFLILFSFIAVPLTIPRVIWLMRSRKAVGVMGFDGRGTAGEQIQLTHSYLYYQPGKERIWFTGPPGLGYKEHDPVPVRYLPARLTEVKVDSFIGLWGDILVYGGIPALIRIWSIHPN